MATSTNVEVILNAKDNASHVIHGVGDSAQKAGSNASEAFTRGGLAAGGFLAAITGLGVAMASVAGNFEQNDVEEFIKEQKENGADNIILILQEQIEKFQQDK